MLGYQVLTCRDMDGLMRSLDNDDDGLRPAESLLRRIRAGILEDLKPIRPLAPSRILLLGFAIVFLAVVAVGVVLLGMNGWGALSLLPRIVVLA